MLLQIKRSECIPGLLVVSKQAKLRDVYPLRSSSSWFSCCVAFYSKINFTCWVASRPFKSPLRPFRFGTLPFYRSTPSHKWEPTPPVTLGGCPHILEASQGIHASRRFSGNLPAHRHPPNQKRIPSQNCCLPFPPLAPKSTFSPYLTSSCYIS